MGIEVVVGIAAIVGAGASVVSTVVSASAAGKAAKAQRKLQALRTAQQRREQIREARVRRGRIANIAAQSGTQGSSGELGARGGIQTQLATNLSFLDQALGQVQIISQQQARAAKTQAIAGAVSSVSKAIANPRVQQLFT